MTQIDVSKVNFSVDPMMQHKIDQQMQDNQKFAQMINTNITKLFFEYIDYKIKMRENTNIACKGETRSGKSTAMIYVSKYIESRSNVPFTIDHICANESEYYQKVKNAKFMETFQIDEQKESKFGTGSFREELVNGFPMTTFDGDYGCSAS